MGRMDRVNQQVKREIGRIIHQELADPRLEFVTITAVDVSRDLRSAKVLYSVLGDEKQMRAAEKGLAGAAGMIRKLLARYLKIRNTPELFFSYDMSIAMSARIEETLREIHDEHKENHSGDSQA